MFLLVLIDQREGSDTPFIFQRRSLRQPNSIIKTMWMHVVETVVECVDTD